MNPPHNSLAVTAAESLDAELADGFTDALPAGSVVQVITSRDEIDIRAAALQAKLSALGISDLTEEGSLVLSGVTEITPGVRRGVALTGGVIATSHDVSLETPA